MDETEIADEIEITHARIEQVTGRRPLGFRGPGFSCPDEVLRVLARNDYVYDASIFPTSIAPIARAVFLLKSDLRGAQRERAKRLYGGFRSLLNPNRPYQRFAGPVPGQHPLNQRQSVKRQSLWELPVTVMPLARTPIHFSYFTYLASFSVLAAKAYFHTALALCRLTRTPPSLLLHPPDFLGREDDTDMSYFPGMNMPRQDKLRIVRWALQQYSEMFDVHCLIDQVRLLDPSVSSNSHEARDQLDASATLPATVSAR